MRNELGWRAWVAVQVMLLSVLLPVVLVEGAQGDKVAYVGDGFNKTREVAETVSFVRITTSTTARVISFHKPLHSISITNEDSSNAAWVDVNGRTAFNYSKTDGQTFAGSTEFRSASAAFINDKVQVGDIIYITSGADIGAYAIGKVVSTNTVYLTKALTESASSINYTLNSGVKVVASATVSVACGAEEISVLADAGTPVLRITATFQRD